jgi:hypothetical protein
MGTTDVKLGKTLFHQPFVDKDRADEEISQEPPMPIMLGLGVYFKSNGLPLYQFSVENGRGFGKRLWVVNPFVPDAPSDFRGVDPDIANLPPIFQQDGIAVDDLFNHHFFSTIAGCRRRTCR